MKKIIYFNLEKDKFIEKKKEEGEAERAGNCIYHMTCWNGCNILE